ncbi:MAG: hypothetical protein WBV46_10575 [Terriglobales bacterium]
MEAAFGPDGIWTRLLFKAHGYLGTEVSSEVPALRQYRVRDFWAWHRDFERFRDRFHVEFEQFEEWLRSERVIEKEQFLGAYYEKFDRGDEEDLVLS